MSELTETIDLVGDIIEEIADHPKIIPSTAKYIRTMYKCLKVEGFSHQEAIDLTCAAIRSGINIK